MNPYSHLVVAAKLEDMVRPKDPGDYYWGSVAPDIRYPAAVPRRQTHLSPEKIRAFQISHPQLESFLQGYMVHCQADEIELEKIFFQYLPFSLFKRSMTRQHMAVSLELYNFAHEKRTGKISGTYNEMLQAIGLEEAICAKFGRAVSMYAESTKNETRLLELFQMLGLEQNTRIQQYWKAAQRFQKNPLLISTILFGMRNGKIMEQIVQATANRLEAR